MDIQGQNIVVFDCEIKNEIKGDITWGTHDKMGISVACAFDFRVMDYLVFMDDNIEQLIARLNSADIVSGFNIVGFDNKLLNACCQSKLSDKLPIYDLMIESKRALGHSDNARTPGMRLDDHLLGTFGKEHMKTEDGAEAPRMWQRKEYGRAITYCLADVKREAKLFHHVWKGLPVTTPNHGPRVLRDPKTMIQKKKSVVNHATGEVVEVPV